MMIMTMMAKEPTDLQADALAGRSSHGSGGQSSVMMMTMMMR